MSDPSPSKWYPFPVCTKDLLCEKFVKPFGDKIRELCEEKFMSTSARFCFNSSQESLNMMKIERSEINGLVIRPINHEREVLHH